MTATAMSLIRSLLALAAVLTVVIADGPCKVYIFGDITGNPVPLPEVIVPPPGGDVDVPTDTACSNGDARGLYVRACNLMGKTAPDVHEKIKDHLTPLSVVCIDCSPKGISVDIILYCL